MTTTANAQLVFTAVSSDEIPGDTPEVGGDAKSSGPGATIRFNTNPHAGRRRRGNPKYVSKGMKASLALVAAEELQAEGTEPEPAPVASAQKPKRPARKPQANPTAQHRRRIVALGQSFKDLLAQFPDLLTELAGELQLHDPDAARTLGNGVSASIDRFRAKGLSLDRTITIIEGHIARLMTGLPDQVPTWRAARIAEREQKLSELEALRQQIVGDYGVLMEALNSTLQAVLGQRASKSAETESLEMIERYYLAAEGMLKSKSKPFVTPGFSGKKGKGNGKTQNQLDRELQQKANLAALPVRSAPNKPGQR